MGWGALVGIGMASASTAANVWGQQQANETNIELAQENRQWQEYMASTRYQRTMADMRAAGLNPILAYKQGGGPVPSGNVANVGNIMDKVGENTQRAASTALQYKRTGQEVQTMKANENQAREQAKLNKMNEALVEKQLEIKSLEVSSARAENAFAQHQEAFYNTNQGRVAAEAAALQKAFPGYTIDRLFKLGLLGTLSGKRTLDIVQAPNSARSQKKQRPIKMPPSEKPPHFKGKKAGNWQKFYSPTR